MSTRLTTLLLLCVPYAGTYGIYHWCRRHRNLNDEVEVTPLLRRGLAVHFLYFVGVPVLMEAFQDAPGIDFLVGPAPAPSNVLFMLSCLAAENFFVTSTALAMILLQETVPRWTLLTPIAQLAWNLKNHVAWYFLGNHFAPEGPLLFALLDMVLIWPITGIYAHHFVTARNVGHRKD